LIQITPLTSPQETTEDTLIQALDKQLAEIIKFFMAKEAEILGKLEQLDLEVNSSAAVGRGAQTERSLFIFNTSSSLHGPT